VELFQHSAGICCYAGLNLDLIGHGFVRSDAMSPIAT
jgi:hypothetical protein